MEFNGESIKNIAVAAGQAVAEREYWLDRMAGEILKSSFRDTSAVYDLKAIPEMRKMETAELNLTSEMVARLLWISNESDVRLHIILVSGIVLLLNKYTSNKEIIIGTPIYKQEVEGDFINTVLVLRIIIDDDTSFKELIMQVQQTISEAVTYQNYPLKSLLYELNIPYEEENFPLFDTVLLLRNIQDKRYIEHIKSDIYFSFLREGESISAVVEYNGSLFSKERIARISDHFRMLLSSALNNLESKLADITIVSLIERNYLLYELNKTMYEIPEGQVIQQLFEEQASLTGDSIAVVMNDGYLTYGGLNETANRLAGELKRKGVGPNVLVGLLAERSADIPISILAILKAGGAYLPIDASVPDERLESMVIDSNINILMVQDGLNKNLAYVPEVLRLNIQMTAGEDSSNFGCVNKTFDIIYVIYTSGSTGIPKGVVLQHGSVFNMLVCRKELYRMKKKDVSLLFFPYHFDGFVTGFFTPLISGARTVILSEEEIKDINRTKGVITRHGVTHFICIPQLYHQVIESLSPQEARTLKTITLAGDKLYRDVIETTKQKCPDIEVVNEYGVTEGAVMSTISRHQDEDKYITIGKPIWNNTIVIITSAGRLQGIGIPGELCISGRGIARGYLNNPGLTHEKFVANPFFTGERLYRSGDCARWLPDGNLEFLGRIDQQVKIRGFRIELGEIEAQLKRHPLVREAVAIVRGKEEFDRHICAYIVPDDHVADSDLIEYLSKLLPEYMIPSYIIKMEKIPLTAAGKIDRKALPEPEISRGYRYTAPRNILEKKLAHLWSEILDIDKEQIGIEANFFEMGGHSLKATMLINQLERELDVKVPVTTIFTSPTIKHLAEYIQSAEKANAISLKPIDKKCFYRLSSVQRRMFLLQELAADSIAYNIPGFLMIEGSVDINLLEAVFIQLMERHESLRTSFHLLDEEPIQVIHDIDEVGFNIVCHDLREKSARGEISSYVTFSEAVEIIRGFIIPFDLKKVPLLRAVLIKLSTEQHILFVDMHHIISDGLSLRIFIEDFVSAYKGEELPQLKFQYKDFAEWGNSEEYKEKIARQEKFWLSEFKKEIKRLELPIDFCRPAILSFAGEEIGFDLDGSRSEALNKIATECGATSFMIILALYTIFLSKLNNQEDIVVGVPISGRSHADLDRIVGMFVNTLAMRNYPQGSKTFKEFLYEVKQKTIKATENQDYPYEYLVEKLETQRDPGRNPLFDVLLDYGNIDLPEFKIPGLKIEIHEIQLQRTKSDLYLYAVEKDDIFSFKLSYCADLFKKNTIMWMIERFFVLIDSIIESPGSKIKDLKFKTREERQLDIVENVEFDF